MGNKNSLKEFTCSCLRQKSCNLNARIPSYSLYSLNTERTGSLHSYFCYLVCENMAGQSQMQLTRKSRPHVAPLLRDREHVHGLSPAICKLQQRDPCFQSYARRDALGNSERASKRSTIGVCQEKWFLKVTLGFSDSVCPLNNIILRLLMRNSANIVDVNINIDFICGLFENSAGFVVLRSLR